MVPLLWSQDMLVPSTACENMLRAVPTMKVIQAVVSMVFIGALLHRCHPLPKWFVSLSSPLGG